MADKDSAPKTFGLADVRAIARILRQYDLSEIEVEVEEARVLLRRELGTAQGASALSALTAAPIVPADQSTAATASPAGGGSEAEEKTHIVTSPFVGTFYRAPGPQSAAFCNVGDSVHKGQTLCIVEAMKLMNEIEADVSGRIVDVLVKNGVAVEYGQPLFKIELS